MPRERFAQGGVALDITEGKLFPEGNLGERQRADQEIVHTQDQRSSAYTLRTQNGATGDRPGLFDEPDHRP
jgi:hypothetical protein